MYGHCSMHWKSSSKWKFTIYDTQHKALRFSYDGQRLDLSTYRQARYTPISPALVLCFPFPNSMRKLWSFLKLDLSAPDHSIRS
jgi:hypothetical protein